MRVELYGGISANPASWRLQSQMPKEMKDVVLAHQEATEKVADSLYAEAEGLSGDAYDRKIEQANRAQAQVATSRMRLEGKEGLKLLKEDLAGDFDAGLAVPVSTNAVLWTILFGYETRRPSEAWLTNRPKDGKLNLTVVTTPSGHVGSTQQAQMANYEQFARTNRYIVEVHRRDSSGKETRLSREEFGVKNPPEYASESPNIQIDLNGLDGKLVVRGWAVGSAGVGGYRAGRETIIHLK